MTARLLPSTEQRIWLGAGAAAHVPAELDRLRGSRVLIVASRSVATGTPVVKQLEAALGKRHAGTFVGIGAHTPAADVEDAAVKAADVNADALVSVGGGAVIDGAKHVAFALSQDFTERLPHHVAVPTTLSAAEFSHLAGITRDHVKQGIADRRLVPAVAILDATVARHTPRELWAITGVRSLDHAIEGVLTNAGDAGVDTHCIGAIEALVTDLPRSVKDASDETAAAACQQAAWDSSFGITRANAARGLSHALGKAIGATYGIPHGLTSALTMPPVLRYAATKQPEPMRRIAQALGATPDAAAVAPAVERLLDALAIQRRPLREHGIKREDIPAIALYAVGSPDPAIVRLVESMW